MPLEHLSKSRNVLNLPSLSARFSKSYKKVVGVKLCPLQQYRVFKRVLQSRKEHFRAANAFNIF